MTKPPVDYLSYMLRLWRTGPDSPWKASLEDPQTGERVGFGSLEALFEFLQRQVVLISIQGEDHGLTAQEKDSNEGIRSP